MTEDKLKQKLFEIMYTLDEKSVKKDYEALRSKHYENMDWISENGLLNEYYDYFFAKINEQRNEYKESNPGETIQVGKYKGVENV